MQPASDKQDAAPSGQEEAAARDDPPSVWEWVAAGIGLVLLAGSLVFLLVDGWTGGNGAPEPVVRMGRIEQQEGRYLVQVRVFNQGAAAAAALRVEGELRRGSEVLERSELEFDHVPGKSAREGGMFFQRDPRALELVLSARSYHKP